MTDQSTRDHVSSCYLDEFSMWVEEGLNEHQIRSKADEYAITRIEWALSQDENWRETKRHIKEIVRMNKIVKENWIK
ncbi:hypothetical protein [Paenibacillus sp. IITD108]|uniref:hypothetical protein n=1 Tax=Paenibacillus sp. IITD108 TaxID=3116649 RepID=UPI002F3F7490